MRKALLFGAWVVLFLLSTVGVFAVSWILYLSHLSTDVAQAAAVFTWVMILQIVPIAIPVSLWFSCKIWPEMDRQALWVSMAVVTGSCTGLVPTMLALSGNL